MEITKKTFAGTLESSDIFVEIAPNNGRKILLESVVLDQFGEEIKKLVLSVLDDFGVDNIEISLKDRGALDCTIRARIETALKRQKEGK